MEKIYCIIFSHSTSRLTGINIQQNLKARTGSGFGCHCVCMYVCVGGLQTARGKLQLL